MRASTPTDFSRDAVSAFAIARTVSSVWRQEKIAEEAADIARLSKELHAHLATMGGHVARVGGKAN